MSLEIENIELQKQVLDLQKQVVKSEHRAVSFKEINDQINNFPKLAEMKMEMDYYLAMAAQFSRAKAFGDYTPEQCYVLMKAGQEMGLKEVEAMQMLYIVNGKVRPYGDKMLAVILKAGYKIQYLNETPTSVEVRVFHEDGFDVIEKADVKDKILENSKAIKFAPKNKLRFHGIRMIASFHLPHLFGSTSDEFTSDYIEYEDANKKPESELKSLTVADSEQLAAIVEHLAKCENVIDVDLLYDSLDDNEQKKLKAIFTKKKLEFK